MLHGIRIKLPIWVAIAVAAAVYVGRSILRGFDFRPDLPGDAVAPVLFAAVLGIVAYVRTKYGRDDSEGGSCPRADTDDDRSPDDSHEPSGDADR